MGGRPARRTRTARARAKLHHSRTEGRTDGRTERRTGDGAPTRRSGFEEGEKKTIGRRPSFSRTYSGELYLRILGTLKRRQQQSKPRTRHVHETRGNDHQFITRLARRRRESETSELKRTRDYNSKVEKNELLKKEGETDGGKEKEKVSRAKAAPLIGIKGKKFPRPTN